MKLYNVKEGAGPLIISIPHVGTCVPDDIKAQMTKAALIFSDTDWHVDRLYQDFAKAHDVTIIAANYSRYVVDLNRPLDDKPLYPGQTKISLCPDKTFDGQDIYKDGKAPDDKEIAERVKKYWKPYHDELEKQIERVKEQNGYAIVYDAHSICSKVPRLFEGTLPDLNLGTAGGNSCSKGMAQAAFDAAQKSLYSAVLDGRFVGGYITRHYGDPANNIHALQMELAQSIYMDENSFTYDEVKARRLKQILGDVLQAVMNVV